jgi:hypothetical protein
MRFYECSERQIAHVVQVTRLGFEGCFPSLHFRDLDWIVASEFLPTESDESLPVHALRSGDTPIVLPITYHHPQRGGASTAGLAGPFHVRLQAPSL